MPLPNNTKGSLFSRGNSGKASGQTKPGLSTSPVRGVKMGNGASSASTALDGDVHEHLNNKKLIPDLRAEIKIRDAKILKYETELLEKKRILEEKCAEITKLRAEVDKLQSVLQIKVHKDAGNPDILATIHENSSVPGQEGRSKKQGVSAESPMSSQHGTVVEIKRHEKEIRSKQLIKDAILDNDFLKNLDSTQVREIVDTMYEKQVKQGHYIIREGESGQHLYVSADGELEVLKGSKVLGKMVAGRAFGELAILYNCTRTASVRALSDVKVWVLDRRVFQAIMMKTGIQRQEENIRFLRSVPLLKKLPTEKLSKIADVLEVDFFHEHQYIIREGGTGDTFFIINNGEVKVTQKIAGFEDPQLIRTLKRGDYFGEKALLSEDRRTANVIAQAPGVECLTVDRDSFSKLIGDLKELQEKDYGDEARGAQRLSENKNDSQEQRSSGGNGSEVPLSPMREKVGQEYLDIQLDHLELVATLGMGGFGRVELVQLTTDRSRTFALKCLKKKHIVDTRQQEHIYSEKKIMMESNCVFIARMYKTFKDKKYVYMLMEACLGGELWTILRDRGYFDDATARFCVACVVEAFHFLHDRGIIYRDLKPENLLLDSNGTVKLVDFGFAKKMSPGRKTWTFCGTPEYVAPEIILNKGHDRAADYWSLGILMFELLTGSPPFAGTDPMKTYNIILKGIDSIEIPRKISKIANVLIKKLCKDNPAERLGYGKNGIMEIKKHKWFQGFDWDGLNNRKILPSIIPKVRSPTDSSNFDSYPKSMEVPPDELSGWDFDF
ncbi:cGMP-dependent protein kinase 1-like isoform X1 [Pecten maximus]|uniref:cGMP-dependent protein kinase 1-like isoform X1 n=1 Tax=Pecten maximus TaxID=6579 RepID=UPI0014580BA8|nr:cGMP-dependent protein kinase 1-like isoform X1 [Pecten maximus]XP_033750058.1 cGMP-dependent protein kinase 1-like isoform X1 [Pecten maximus]XP_033750068.1 cGMP-dependent protein kinase 1-like isoform X1 [Pecten maximus]